MTPGNLLILQQVHKCAIVFNVDYHQTVCPLCSLFNTLKVNNSLGCLVTLTLMPSNLDRALRGLRARRVLRDLIAPNSE